MPGLVVQSCYGPVCLVLAELACKRQLALHVEGARQHCKAIKVCA